MTGRAGHLPDAAILETGSQIYLGNLTAPQLIIANWFENMNATLGALPTTAAGRMFAAELLVEQLEMEGWPLSDMASGAIQGCVPSDLSDETDKAR